MHDLKFPSDIQVVDGNFVWNLKWITNWPPLLLHNLCPLKSENLSRVVWILSYINECFNMLGRQIDLKQVIILFSSIN